MAEGEVQAKAARPWWQVLWGFLRSTIGMKFLMALSGAALWLFVIVHLIGNLQVLTGTPEAINAYGVELREIGHGALVWLARGGLLLAFVVHIWTGLRLAALNRTARPHSYGRKRTVQTNVAALTMATSGIAIFVFLIIHLAHFTWGWIMPEAFALTETYEDGKTRHDIFRMVWTSFKVPGMVAFYVVAQVLLLGHLYHGAVSLFQSVGVHHRVWSAAIRVVGHAIVALIIAGNVGIPLAIFLTWPNP